MKIIKRLFWFIVALVVVVVIVDSFSDVPLIVPTRTCPTSDLTPEQAEQITKEAKGILFKEEYPERYRTVDLEKGMPMLRRALVVPWVFF